MCRCAAAAAAGYYGVVAAAQLPRQPRPAGPPGGCGARQSNTVAAPDPFRDGRDFPTTKGLLSSPEEERRRSNWTQTGLNVDVERIPWPRQPHLTSYASVLPSQPLFTSFLPGPTAKSP